ncbi:MAG: S8 family serine peptidase [Myxococcales bacterium]|nr:S8 family serine peptidase [Myxococcales bacterium]
MIAKLPDPEVFAMAKDLSDIERATSVQGRASRLRPIQDGFEAAVRAHGAKDISKFWIDNLVGLTLPAGRLGAALSIPGVLDWDEVRSDGRDATVYWDMTHVRAAAGFNDYIDAGYRGQSGSRAYAGQAPVRVGIMEFQRQDISALNWVSWNHPGLVTGRLLNARICSAALCAESSGWLPSYSSHGTATTGFVAGSIEGFGGPFIYTPEDEVARSGVSSGATMHYYLVGTTEALIRGLEDGVGTLALDLMNMSFTICDRCGANTPGYDCGFINGAIRNALNNGLLVVAAAGNDGHAGIACTQGYPAILPETLAVGGYDSSWNGQTVLADKPVAGNYYPDGGGITGTARGGVAMRTFAGTSSAYAGVDILGPYHVGYAYGNPADPLKVYYPFSGTSASAPVLTGALALLKSGFYGLRGRQLSAKELIPLALVMGDSFAHVADGVANTYIRADMSDVSGAGRLRMRLPSNAAFPGQAWQFDAGSFDLRSTDVRIGELATPFTHHRYALTWYGESTDALSDVDVAAYRVCGGTETLIRAHADFDPRKRLHTLGTDVPPGCTLRVKVAPVAFPPGKTLRLYDAWLWHNGVDP